MLVPEQIVFQFQLPSHALASTSPCPIASSVSFLNCELIKNRQMSNLSFIFPPPGPKMVGMLSRHAIQFCFVFNT